MYLSKLVGEITHEDRPNLHESCQNRMLDLK